MKIKRRIFDRKTDEIKDKVETVELVERLSNTVRVRLGNGDVISRKLADVVGEES